MARTSRWTSAAPGCAASWTTTESSSGKAEFHPYSEKLWIYDTANDGDTFSVDVRVQRTPVSKGDELVGTYSPPGTSKEVDYRAHDLDIPEGNHIELGFGDEADSPSFAESKRGFA